MKTAAKRVLGLLAQVDGPGELIAAAARLREAGYTRFECHSPFAIHGLEAAAGEKPSRVSFVSGFGAFFGLILAFGGMAWMNAVDYPHIISGKPFLSYQAYTPITFALAVLFASLGALFGVIAMMRPRYHHPVFYSDRFAQFSDHGFFVSVEASDPKFDAEGTRHILEDLGGKNVEILEGV
ncbi:MAG: DUF3341 domain-containing protein [Candidatus Zixiibacteriota bacterium]|nr:MAG: DUF3341 domain-containing protein [candidate division Zixibacteria bacterium]